jgi:hypothetical protein
VRTGLSSSGVKKEKGWAWGKGVLIAHRLSCGEPKASTSMLEACAPTFFARSGSASSMNLRTASLLGSRPRITMGSSLSSVLTLARAFRSWAERPIVLNLSGGMRLLVVEALCATLISRVPMTVEVESEDVKVLVTFSTDDLSFP